MDLLHVYPVYPGVTIKKQSFTNPYGSKYLLRKCLGYDLEGKVPSQTVFGSSWAAECTPFWEADRAGAIRPTLAFAALYWAYTGRVKRKNGSGHSQFTIHRSSCLLAPGRSQYNIPAAPGITSQFSTQVVGKLQWFPCPRRHIQNDC
jgi:hypothetical protein